jgi:hypothetical protein
MSNIKNKLKNFEISSKLDEELKSQKVSQKRKSINLTQLHKQNQY